MPTKRAIILITSITALFTVLTLRFFYLQIISGPRLSRAASAQRIANSQIDKSRGELLDRNGIPFTSREKKITLVLKPMLLKGRENDIRQIARIVGCDYDRLKQDIETKREPVVFDVDEEKKRQIQALNIESASFIHSLKRYDDNSLARHILGYLNKADQVGETGVEKYYEEYLRYSRENTVSVVTDARNNVLQGLGYRINKTGGRTRELHLQLTLDYRIQRIVEEVMERNNINGAVVIEDIYTGDIAAIASKPDFDQNNVGRYLVSPKKELFNRSVASYNLGSIFKIIDTVAYYEKGFRDEPYFCEGSIRLGDKEFRCSAFEKGGHGWVNLKEAFALSCNPYFINMGVKLGYKDLTAAAKRFGLGSTMGLEVQGLNESPGYLPAGKKYYTDGDVANISIGQGDVMATPLQIADLVATVANGGIKNNVNVVGAVVNGNGETVREIRREGGTRVLSKDIADRVKELMEEVTSSGTGSRANLEEFGGAGGKTGSAETGQLIQGEKVVHAWFAGYFPRRQPKYSMAVFVENGKAGSLVAAPVFEEIAREIMKKGF